MPAGRQQAGRQCGKKAEKKRERKDGSSNPDREELALCNSQFPQKSHSASSFLAPLRLHVLIAENANSSKAVAATTECFNGEGSTRGRHTG